MAEHISETIMIGKEAYMYLDRESRKQRGCKALSLEWEDRLWKRVLRCRSNAKGEKVRVDDNSFGGGDGTYNGRWWVWKVQTLKEMLDEAGLKYEEGEDVRYVNL